MLEVGQNQICKMPAGCSEKVFPSLYWGFISVRIRMRGYAKGIETYLIHLPRRKTKTHSGTEHIETLVL